MNYTKALMGLTLFASINTLAMKMDHNESYAIDDTNAQSADSADIVYNLYCGMCNKFVRQSPENKKIFHSKCLESVAESAFVKNNPVIAPEPWKETTRGFETRYTAFRNYKKRMAKKNQPK